MSGWCVANLIPLNPRERALAMVAATAPDLDGLGVIGGEEWYWKTHHIFGHNLIFALFLAGTLTCFAQHRWRAFLLFLALAHLHFVMDFFGSGPLWTIPYLWPTKQWIWKNPYAWDLFSWQNITAAVVMMVWTIVIAIKCGRTPLEAVMPNLDRKLVAMLRRQRVDDANSRSSATANC